MAESYIRGIAKQVPGLSLAQWQSDRSNPELAGELETDKQVANDEGFTGTPSFLIGRTGGGTKQLAYPSAPGEPSFVEEAVEKLLKS